MEEWWTRTNHGRRSDGSDVFESGAYCGLLFTVWILQHTKAFSYGFEFNYSSFM